jgi:hypothetical protein
MLRSVSISPIPGEGYVYVVYGSEKYLRHAIASVLSLRRHDVDRKVALICEQHHKDILEKTGLFHLFDQYVSLHPDHRSIVGFKHNVHKYMIFERNMYLDSDIVWCKNPDSLWTSLAPHPFTITGTLVSDPFFGAPKGFAILKDVFLNHRKRTLKRFGLTYLSRVQSGMIYARDPETTRQVCETATEMLSRKSETHFRSRTLEEGRNEESCEWSLAMAMSKLNVPVYPWLQGVHSPQLDFIEDLTQYDPEFEYVSCKYYSNHFVYSLRGLKSRRIRNFWLKLFSLFPGNGDFMNVTPYCLHFGWYHQKQPFNNFSDLVWHRLTTRSSRHSAAKQSTSDNDQKLSTF